MAKKSAIRIKMISIALMVTGTCLAFWGYQQSGSLGSQVTKVISGSYSDKVMILYIGGAVSFITGLYLNIKK